MSGISSRCHMLGSVVVSGGWALCLAPHCAVICWVVLWFQRAGFCVWHLRALSHAG